MGGATTFFTEIYDGLGFFFLKNRGGAGLFLRKNMTGQDFFHSKKGRSGHFSKRYFPKTRGCRWAFREKGPNLHPVILDK